MLAACAEPDRPLSSVTEALLALVAFGRHCRTAFSQRWATISPALRRSLAQTDESSQLYAVRCIEEHTRPLIVAGEEDTQPIQLDAGGAGEQEEADSETSAAQSDFWSELLRSHVKLAVADSRAPAVVVAGVSCLANIPSPVYAGLSVEVREWVFGIIRKAVAHTQHPVRAEGWRALGWLCRHPTARSDAHFNDQSGHLLVAAMRKERHNTVRVRCVWCVANLCGALAEHGASMREEGTVAPPSPGATESLSGPVQATDTQEPQDASVTVSFAGEGMTNNQAV